jgi:hypothetical protein
MDLLLPQTKGLSLEEINGRFGDEVIVHFADATEKQRKNLTAAVLAEDEEKGVAPSHAESAVPETTPETLAKSVPAQV